MKTVSFEPIKENVQVHTRQDLLQALLAKKLNVLMSCGGKGLCATCHVYIEKGHQSLTPPTDREKMTLGIISRANENSRLACQCKIIGEGVTVKLPDGMYIEKEEDLMDMVGQRATKDILSPVDGAVLIKKGKLITRSRLRQLKNLKVTVEGLKS